MPNSSLFDFRDASIYGDPKWTQHSPHFGRYAPPVVISLAVLCIIEVVLGVVWITGISSLGGGWGALTFTQVIQPLVVPALSVFNTIPSLHLHVLARSNPPLLAIIFSTFFAVVYFGSAIVFLPPCVSGNAVANSSSFGAGNGGNGQGQTTHIPGYQKTECPAGSHRGVWAAMVALQLLSSIGYAVHAAMAWRVDKGLKEHRKALASGDIVELVDEETKREREEEARRRWREQGSHF